MKKKKFKAQSEFVTTNADEEKLNKILFFQNKNELENSNNDSNLPCLKKKCFDKKTIDFNINLDKKQNNTNNFQSNYKNCDLSHTKQFSEKIDEDYINDSTLVSFKSYKENSNILTQNFSGINYINDSLDEIYHKNNYERQKDFEIQNHRKIVFKKNDETSEEEYYQFKEKETIMGLITNKKFSDLDEKDILNNLLLIARDYNGSVFLQKKIDENPNFLNFELYSEINLNFPKFICDPYGNFLVQKMFDHMTTDELDLFISNVIYTFNN